MRGAPPPPGQKLDVERLVQSWPMRDNEAVVTRARLDSLVQARR
jgi:hypothetical protein